MYMASLAQTPLAQYPGYREMTVEEFLDLEIEGRAELVDGILYMMAGGSPAHAAITLNVGAALRVKLRGSGCRPMSPDMGVRTGPSTVRLPDVSVYCVPVTADERGDKLLGDPTLVAEVLSPSTRSIDLRVKLDEYQALTGCNAVMFIDPEKAIVRLVERTGPNGWSDVWLDKGATVRIASLGIELTAEEIFALD